LPEDYSNFSIEALQYGGRYSRRCDHAHPRSGFDSRNTGLSQSRHFG
jgi:hypothetical protein